MKLDRLPTMRRRIDHLFAADASWLPLQRAAKIPGITHIDDLEQQRSKWATLDSRYYRACESLAVSWSDASLVETGYTAQYCIGQFNARTHAHNHLRGSAARIRLQAPIAGFGVGSRTLPLGRCSSSTENHVDEIADGFAGSSAKLPLADVRSAWCSYAYARNIHFVGGCRVRFLCGAWGQEQQDLYSENSAIYWREYAVFGIKPPRFKALGAGVAVNRCGVGYNREVLRSAGAFARMAAGNPALIQRTESDRAKLETCGCRSRI
ncbi:hypothetical protein ACTXOR_03790 [Arthrobacter rhombi]|uniref:hypothetical protein n=1 Tax=Arthrobacter rhombi TaxID=71253 RepID=UPI003FD3FCAC